MDFNTKYSKDYQNGDLSFNTVIPVTDEDYLRVMRYAYGSYVYGDSVVGSNGIFTNGRNGGRSIQELRDHAMGVQDVEQYKDQVDPKNKRGKRGLNISFEPDKTLLKFRDILKDKFLSIMLSPKTEAIDETASMERLSKKNFLMLTRQRDTQEFLANTSVSVEEGPDEEGMETTDDVDFIFKMGGLRLAEEIVMKDVIDITIDKSGWDVLWPMVIDDIIDINAFCVDQEDYNGQQRIVYVDPKCTIIPPSIYPDYRDVPYRGYTQHKNINELVMLHDFSKDQMVQIGKAYKRQDQYGRSRGEREDYVRNISGSGGDFGVDVMKMYFIVQAKKRFITGQHNRGSRQFEEVPGDFVLTDRMKKAGKEIVEYPIQYLYQCSWIIGTDVVFNNGVVNDIVREGQPGAKSIVWPMTYFCGHQDSLISRCIALDHDIQIANLKQRSMIASLPPAPRMILYMSQLSDTIKLGDDSYSVLDMVGMYQRHGYMVLDDRGEYSMPGEDRANARPPVDFVESGIERDMMMLEQRIMQKTQSIRAALGINEFVDGTSTQGDMLKHVAQGMENSTNSALRPHIDLMISGYRAVIKHIAFKYRNMAFNGELNLGYLPISENYTRLVVADKSLYKYEWGITVDVGSRESQQMLLTDLMSRKDMLPPDSYFIVMNTVMAGDTKKGQYLLAKYTQRAQNAAHERQMQMAQAASQGNAQAAMAAEEAKVKTLEAQHLFGEKSREHEFSLNKKKSEEDFGREMIRITEQERLKKESAVAVVSENNRNRLNQ